MTTETTNTTTNTTTTTTTTTTIHIHTHTHTPPRPGCYYYGKRGATREWECEEEEEEEDMGLVPGWRLPVSRLADRFPSGLASASCFFLLPFFPSFSLHPATSIGCIHPSIHPCTHVWIPNPCPSIAIHCHSLPSIAIHSFHQPTIPIEPTNPTNTTQPNQPPTRHSINQRPSPYVHPLGLTDLTRSTLPGRGGGTAKQAKAKHTRYGMR